MGTNYYIETGQQTKCHKCGSTIPERLHIGKASAGWQFLFAPYPERGLTTGRAWKEMISHSPHSVVDEYGNLVNKLDFWHMVEARSQDNTSADNETSTDGYRFAGTTDFC